jgi:hypothetical protein
MPLEPVYVDPLWTWVILPSGDIELTTIGVPGAAGAQGPPGPAGPPTTDASLLTSGSVADARLGNAALKNAANTFTAGPQVLVGGVTVRKPAGVAGTDEVQITHNAAAFIESKAGPVKLISPAVFSQTIFELINGSTTVLIGTNNGTGKTWAFASDTNQTIGLDTDVNNPRVHFSIRGQIDWSSNNDQWQGKELGIAKGGPKVVELNDGTYSGPGATLRSVPLTPVQITANQNDYNPGVARFYRLSTDASRTITGFSISQLDGEEFEVWNVGANNLVLAHQSVSSAAANRMICTGAANITLAADEVALVRYDATTQRFRVRKV